MRIYLNSDSMVRYAQLREQGPLSALRESAAAPYVNRYGSGVRTQLAALLAAVTAGRVVAFSVSRFMAGCRVAEWGAGGTGLLSTSHAADRADR